MDKSFLRILRGYHRGNSPSTLAVYSRHWVVGSRINRSDSFLLGFTDKRAVGEAANSPELFGEVQSRDEVVHASSQLVVAVIEIALDGSSLDSLVHAF
jgi:hypothetical protein